MSQSQPISYDQFSAAFLEFLVKVSSQTVPVESFFRETLLKHFGKEPTDFPVVGDSFPLSDHPNIHLAIEAYLSRRGRKHELYGLGDQYDINLALLAAPSAASLFGTYIPRRGPVQYSDMKLPDGKSLTCVLRGLYLIREGEKRLAVCLRGPSEMSFTRKIHIEVMTEERPHAERFLSDLRQSMRKKNIYRGRAISLYNTDYEGVKVEFHSFPKIDRNDIIMPQGLLEKIERQAITFSRHSEKLLASGRHLKRGILLYGPPGTGKTLTAKYLAGQLRDRTVLLLVGGGLGLIEYSCKIARALQPSIVILEDVDLVAEERTHQTTACNALLFELLNQMDGLTDDADVLFLLTTNRPDILEPALASRPGRIDQAIEVPLPDAECRKRLIRLYGQGLNLRLNDLDQLALKTEGASAAFIRELLRKAALFAADETNEGEQITVEDRHVEDALRELIFEGGELTKSLLGAADI